MDGQDIYTGTTFKNNFKQVCYTCRYREIYIDENTIYGVNTTLAVSSVIGCEHEKVCKLYLESDSE